MMISGDCECPYCALERRLDQTADGREFFDELVTFAREQPRDVARQGLAALVHKLAAKNLSAAYYEGVMAATGRSVSEERLH